MGPTESRRWREKVGYVETFNSSNNFLPFSCFPLHFHKYQHENKITCEFYVELEIFFISIQIRGNMSFLILRKKKHLLPRTKNGKCSYSKPIPRTIFLEGNKHIALKYQKTTFSHRQNTWKVRRRTSFQQKNQKKSR